MTDKKRRRIKIVSDGLGVDTKITDQEGNPIGCVTHLRLEFSAHQPVKAYLTVRGADVQVEADVAEVTTVDADGKVLSICTCGAKAVGGKCSGWCDAVGGG